MSIKVMFLDDEPDICEIYKDFLTTSDIEVYVFSDPKEAITYAHQYPLDLIFLDYRMPGTNGDKVAQQMPKERRIFLITGEINIDTAYPFEKILSKPVNLDELQKMISTQGKEKKSA